MNLKDKSLERGAPWQHQLDIKELAKNYFKAEVSLAGESWTVITSIILFLLGFGLCGIIWITLSKSITGAIIAGIFAVILLTAGFFILGCYSYCAELIIDESHIKFSKCFFWKWKRLNRIRSGNEYIKCWDYILGTGKNSQKSFNLCIHLDEPFPALSVLSIDYISEVNERIITTGGFKTGDFLKEHEALEEILAKAEEIAEKLNIEYRSNIMEKS